MYETIPDSLFLNTGSHFTLAPGEGRLFSSLYLHKHDLAQDTLRKPIKDDEIDRAAEKPCVFWIVGKIGEKWKKVLSDLSTYYRLASLDGIIANYYLFMDSP